jgi:hypothetical protein
VCDVMTDIRHSIMARAFIRCQTFMPSADFRRESRAFCHAFSRESATHSRSPEVSSTAFRKQPPNLQPVRLMQRGPTCFRQGGP